MHNGLLDYANEQFQFSGLVPAFGSLLIALDLLQKPSIRNRAKSSISSCKASYGFTQKG
jgi:hypothetical protein